MPGLPVGRGTGSSRAALRSATRDAHDRVDAAFACFDLSSRTGYTAFLQAHAAALPALEAAVEAAGSSSLLLDLLPDWPERRRTAALLQDLRSLRSAPPEPARPPRLPSPDHVMGALYVLEGSRLGGRLLLARVREGSDPAVLAATAYLAHGEGRRFWPDFLHRLDRCAGEREPMIDGALAAFAMFERAARA